MIFTYQKLAITRFLKKSGNSNKVTLGFTMDYNFIFEIQTAADFEEAALRVFKHQYINNPVYQRFCNLLGMAKGSVTQSNQIPHLPISFFKTKKILSNHKTEQLRFGSSGTTGSVVSNHYVTDVNVYEQSFKKAFHQFYGAPDSYTILALLPSYQERQDSSLIYMVQHLIEASNNPHSGFYLHDTERLATTLKNVDATGQKILLIGVSFALLDLVEQHQFNLKNTIIMETGGMKGRRKELIRSELHNILQKGFGVPKIHSEYGMTELLSQAYSKGDGIFQCPPWMRVTTRDTEDALTIIDVDKTGGINVMDLANYHSCAFIATQDLGKVQKDRSFEILGRFDHSDIRGCNLMAL